MTRSLTWLYLFLCGFFVPALYFFSQNIYWSDSEIWASTVSRELPKWTAGVGLELKPLFYAFLYPGFALAQSSGLWPMQVHRILFFAIGILMAFLVFLILRERQKKTAPHSLSFFIPFVGTLLLMSSSLYLGQGFRVRSDLLASVLYLISLYLLILGPRRSHLFIVFVLVIAATLVTLNSLLFLPVLPLSISYRNLKIPKGVYFAISGAILLTMIFFFSGIKQSLSFFIESLSAQTAGLSYFDLRRLYHVKNWILSDAHILAIFFLKAAHDIYGWRKNLCRSEIKSTAWGYALLMVLVLHPNRLPFLIMSLFPFLIIWMLNLPLLYRWISEKFSTNRLRLALGFFALLCLSHASFHSYRFYRKNGNREQLQAIQFLSERIPAHSSLSILDPIGLLPYHDTLLWYLGPGQIESNHYFAEKFHQVKPDIVLGVQRLDYIWMEIQSDLKGYRDVGLQIYFKNRTLEKINSPSVPVENIYQKLLEAYSPILNREWLIEIQATREDKNLELLGQLFDGNRVAFKSPIEFADLLPFKKLRSRSGEDIETLHISVIPAPSLTEASYMPSLFRFDPNL